MKLYIIFLTIVLSSSYLQGMEDDTKLREYEFKDSEEIFNKAIEQLRFLKGEKKTTTSPQIAALLTYLESTKDITTEYVTQAVQLLAEIGHLQNSVHNDINTKIAQYRNALTGLLETHAKNIISSTPLTKALERIQKTYQKDARPIISAISNYATQGAQITKRWFNFFTHSSTQKERTGAPYLSYSSFAHSFGNNRPTAFPLIPSLISENNKQSIYFVNLTQYPTAQNKIIFKAQHICIIAPDAYNTNDSKGNQRRFNNDTDALKANKQIYVLPLGNEIAKKQFTTPHLIDFTKLPNAQEQLLIIMVAQNFFHSLSEYKFIAETLTVCSRSLRNLIDPKSTDNTSLIKEGRIGHYDSQYVVTHLSSIHPEKRSLIQFFNEVDLVTLQKKAKIITDQISMTQHVAIPEELKDSYRQKKEESNSPPSLVFNEDLTTELREVAQNRRKVVTVPPSEEDISSAQSPAIQTNVIHSLQPKQSSSDTIVLTRDSEKTLAMQSIHTDIPKQINQEEEKNKTESLEISDEQILAQQPILTDDEIKNKKNEQEIKKSDQSSENNDQDWQNESDSESNEYIIEEESSFSLWESMSAIGSWFSKIGASIGSWISNVWSFIRGTSATM